MKNKKIKVNDTLYSINFSIFVFYVFFAPFSYFSFTDSLSSTSFVIPFFISVIGIPLMFFYYYLFLKKMSRKLILLYVAILILFGISIINSFLLKDKYSGFYGLDPFAINLKYTLQTLYTVILCNYLFICCKTFRNERLIYYAFFASANIVAFFGILQFLMLLGVNEIRPFYSIFANIGIVKPDTFIFLTKRLSFTAPEPAWTSTLIVLYIIPFLIFDYISNDKHKFLKIWEIVLIGIFVLLLFYTLSSEVYVSIGFGFLLIVFFYSIKLIKKKNYLMFSAVVFVVFIFIGLAFGVPVLRELLIDKVLSKTNMSTASRVTLPYNAFVVFLKNPIFGVGLGNSAFFYPDNIVNTWMSYSTEVRLMLSGKITLSSHSPTILFFLAGYGIIGFVILSYLIYKLVFSKLKNCKFVRKFPIAYLVPVLTYLFLSIFVELIIANYYMPLLLFSPFLFSLKKEKKYTSLSVLVATFNKTENEIINIVKSLNLESNAIVRNQNKISDKTLIIENNGYTVTIVNSTKDIGASKNRNELLKLAKTDIIIFADDDIKLHKGYCDRIMDLFNFYEDTQGFRFVVNLKNRKSPNNRRRLLNRELSLLDCTDIGPLAYAFDRKYLKENKISFNEQIGPGTDIIKASEDVVFYKDVFNNGATLMADNFVLCDCVNETSTWFDGFTEDYLITVGGAYYLTYGYFCYLFYLRFVLKNRLKLVSNNLKLKEAFILLKTGLDKSIAFKKRHAYDLNSLEIEI